MKKILLIANAEPRLERSLRTKLLARNYEVLDARNLKEAMGRFDLCQIDLLLLDLDVPTQDGWTALSLVSELSPSLPVIALTERSDLAEAAVRARLSAVAEKPLHVRKLLTAIEEVTSQAQFRTTFQYFPPATAAFRRKLFAKAAGPTFGPAVYSRWGINE